MLVRELVQEKETQKKTGTRRSKTLVYYLYNETSQQREQVCKHMLLNTLDIGEWSAANWARRLDNNNNNEGEDSDEPLPESRVSREKVVLQEFFDALPKLESHYCRKDTSKLYLEHNWQSMSQLYREYQSFCKKNASGKVSMWSFRDKFLDNNLSLFSPRKDQCDICYAYKENNVEESTYTAHIERKNMARQEKENDKKKHQQLSESVDCRSSSCLISAFYYSVLSGL